MDEHVEISVQDSGQGINPAFLPHVFDRFRQEDVGTRRKHSGLGLGLSIVQRLVEMHGGTASAESAGTGQGARFIIRLPIKASANGNHATPAYESPGTSHKTFKWSLAG